MGFTQYPMPEGLRAIPRDLLDLRLDDEVDHDILHPKPVSGEKNIWFFWHSGYSNMHRYAQRNVRSWHRRFSKLGWAVRVLDKKPGSPLNVANYLDIQDPNTFPRAFSEGTLDGHHARQHISDLVRFPLLLRYGGVYADVGYVQIGDLDRMWNETVGNPDSPYEVLSYEAGTGSAPTLTNYFLVAGRNNPLFARCHKLLLAIWAADGGKTNTEGMHTSPLVKGVPLTRSELTFEEDGKVYGPSEVSKLLADYIIQGHVISMVFGLVDSDNWNGPQYVAEHVYTIEFVEGAQLINELTAWNGPRQFELLSLPLPRDGEAETADQQQAREVVEAVLRRSFGFKLATGLILRVMGPTLGSLWRDNGDADAVEGTYAGWFRHATTYWNQESLPPNNPFKTLETFKRGPLLEA